LAAHVSWSGPEVHSSPFPHPYKEDKKEISAKNLTYLSNFLN
jgi:hypothetical protein